ncbi:unnamed protein product [Clonostachys solani]|uniref:Ketoreductase domain-containing protein n=1 Tax=Clonostachys solani TaxID=160281 RepID=A0A9N9Z016_9HYPO|nr:unnamed protein product [Clonostachys solani]
MSLPILKKYHKEPYPGISPTRPELSQKGKTVLVAGGSTGIGYAIAEAFITAQADRVIVTGRRAGVLAESVAQLKKDTQKSSPATIVEAKVIDVSNLEESKQLWARLESDGVYVDTLVLNAASFGQKKPILETKFEDVWNDFEINVRAPLDLTQRFYKQTTGKGQKYLVNVSTIAAYMWALAAERPTYGLTKSAGTLLVQQIAKDISADDIQIVSFHPGAVLTEAAKRDGIDNLPIKWDDVNLAGQTAVWAATPEAKFLHGRFFWANWDVDEVKHGEVAKQIGEDINFLKVGMDGLAEKNGGFIV